MAKLVEVTTRYKYYESEIADLIVADILKNHDQKVDPKIVRMLVSSGYAEDDPATFNYAEVIITTTEEKKK